MLVLVFMKVYRFIKRGYSVNKNLHFYLPTSPVGLKMHDSTKRKQADNMLKNKNIVNKKRAKIGKKDDFRQTQNIV